MLFQRSEKVRNTYLDKQNWVVQYKSSLKFQEMKNNMPEPDIPLSTLEEINEKFASFGEQHSRALDKKLRFYQKNLSPQQK